jgi:hypothetical protein
MFFIFIKKFNMLKIELLPHANFPVYKCIIIYIVLVSLASMLIKFFT